MIRVILWDIDNTLLDFNVAEVAALKQEFQEFGLGEFTEELLKEYMVINRRRWQALERGEMEKLEVTEGRFVEFFGLHGWDTSIASQFNLRYQELLGETICFRDDGYHIVEDLKGKILQGAATNGTKRAQTGKLKNSGLGELFDLVFISEDVGFEKPAMEFFDKVMEDANTWLKEHEAECPYSGGKHLGALKPEEVLMVGDSLTSDMRGANNAGMIACWYNPKGMVNDKGVKIDYEIKDLHEVLNLL